MKKVAYKTKQSDTIWHYIETLGSNHFTAAELIHGLNNNGYDIGTATVYRFLDKESKENKLSKFIMDGNSSATYQNNSNSCCNNSYHFKCDSCGALIHLHCKAIQGLQSHCNQEHGFKINTIKTTFYGTCSKCLQVNSAHNS